MFFGGSSVRAATPIAALTRRTLSKVNPSAMTARHPSVPNTIIGGQAFASAFFLPDVEKRQKQRPAPLLYCLKMPTCRVGLVLVLPFTMVTPFGPPTTAVPSLVVAGGGVGIVLATTGVGVSVGLPRYCSRACAATRSGSAAV